MILALIKTMRPKQWAKNVLMFAAVVFDRKLTNYPALTHTLVGFVLFSLLASTIYIINDIADVEADRRHPRKRHRPIAAGKLSIKAAWTTAIVLIAIVFPLAYRLSPGFAAVCLFYFVLNLSYSKWLKHVALVDVLALASFYVIRVVAGVTIIQVERFSPWLYLSITFLALLMGVGKRRAEFVLAQETGDNHRRVLLAYTLPFLDQLINIVLTTTILTYSLYTFSAPNLPENHVMMLTIPFVIYAVFRYLYLVQVMGHGEAPDELVFSDRPLQVSIVVWGLSILLIFYIF
jgi:4-hydroxybenzoate polyprenyltransferase